MKSFTSPKPTPTPTATPTPTPPAPISINHSSLTPSHSLPFPKKPTHHPPLKIHSNPSSQSKLPTPTPTPTPTPSPQSQKLKIAIIGFGNYGQFLSKTFIKQGHTVFAHSRTDYSLIANSLGATFFKDPNDLCERHPDVILISSSILSTKQVLLSIPVLRLKRSTLFVDVLSVKEFPKDLFVEFLPPYFDVLCTHPMFGPESGRETWRGLPFVYDKVRIGDQERVESFLGIFAKEGCRMVEMTCAEHDKYAAGSQFITHTMGRVLEKMALGSTPINTRGYETLLDLVENTSSDSFDLYYGLFMYNENAMEVLQSLGEAFEELKMELFRHLHKHNRNQLFGTQGKFKVKINGGALPSQNGNSLALPSQRSNDTGEPKVDPPLQNGNSGELPAQPSNDTMKAKVHSPSSQTCD